uniref:Putative secreted protein n=1 Tax=Anopheles triannulatus TaxID=58253 RepID=A0A2M4B3G7_9DIPT
MLLLLMMVEMVSLMQVCGMRLLVMMCDQATGRRTIIAVVSAVAVRWQTAGCGRTTAVGHTDASHIAVAAANTIRRMGHVAAQWCAVTIVIVTHAAPR